MEQIEINSNSTICAISTPPGVGGIAVCRLSGPDAIAVADRIWRGKPLANADSHTAHLGEVIDAQGDTLDQGVATVFRAPRSFTGQDTVEISVHGSRYVQKAIIESLINAGARLAQPGEFTRRAFASGRFDLAQAEAVADIIASESKAAHRIALSQMKGGISQRLSELREKLLTLASLLELELDFSEEDVEFADRQHLSSLTQEILNEVTRLLDSFSSGSAIKNGIPVAIVGKTNAGKSSLLNLLVGDNRAIVSDIHGTTRDTIEETVTIGEYLFRLIDTAGIRHTDDRIEQLGIDRSLQALDRARIILIVTDSTAPLDNEIIDRATAATHASPILILNKTDLLPSPITQLHLPSGITLIPFSALTGEGLDALRNQLVNIARADDSSHGDILVTNLRHAEALDAARESLTRTLDSLSNNIPGDLVAQDLRQALSHLASITGEIPSSEILANVFNRFCIGK